MFPLRFDLKMIEIKGARYLFKTVEPPQVWTSLEEFYNAFVEKLAIN